jgi:hypothetical protein
MKVAFDDPALRRLIARVAAERGVPIRPLELQVLLHLPRIADDNGFVRPDDAASEVDRAVDLVPPEPEWDRVGRADEHPRHWRLGPLDSADAEFITGRFHYLRSARWESTHYGLWAGKGALPHAMVSVSRNDVDRLRMLTGSSGESRVLSRVFAFPGAPRNVLSRLISFAARNERRAGVSALVTYVNPNLGFTGVSYRASDWTYVGDDICRYRYLDGRYITDRELVVRFGLVDISQLDESLAGVEVSRMKLQDLMVFGREIGGRRHSPPEHRERGSPDA